MAKYDPLVSHLSIAARPCDMSFEAIARLVGGLPMSAYAHRAWWANDHTHVQARAWLGTDRIVLAVDLVQGVVRFS